MILAITGHTNIERACERLMLHDGAEYDHISLDTVYKELQAGLFKYCFDSNIDVNSVTLVSGMARGVDEVWALLAISLNLKLILSIPHSVSWHKNRGLSRGSRVQAINYDFILNYDKSEIVEIKKSYGTGNHFFANFARNQHMVDISDGVFSYKRYDSAGTDDCINRSKQKGNYISNL